MPVTDVHKSCLNRSIDWQTCRDCVEGPGAIKAQGETYLPKLSGMDVTDYDTYKMRADFWNATSRTVQGTVGAIMRKDPDVVAPDEIKAILDDITLDGTPFVEFAGDALEENVIVGWGGILTDYSDVEERPYLRMYVAEQVINWRRSRVGGYTAVTLVVLRETTEEAGEDVFGAKTVEQYRVLRLVPVPKRPDDPDPDGEWVIGYKMEVWRKEDKGDDWYIYEEHIPTVAGEALLEIPFDFLTPSGTVPQVEKPPILDLAEINVSHYRTSAELEHALLFCVPTPYAAGYDPDTKIYLGASKAYVSDQADAKIAFAEFTGQGVQPIVDNLERKSKQLAILGARLLEEQKKAQEAAETVRLRQAGEQATLRDLAIATSLCLTKALQRVAVWFLVNPSKVKVTLNMDFFSNVMTGEEALQWVEGWQRGGWSYDVAYQALQRGEATIPGRTAEEERNIIEIQKPASAELNIDLGQF